MRIAVIAVTARGCEISKTIEEGMHNEGNTCCRYLLAKYCKETASETVVPFASLPALTGEIFHQYDALVFISACAIAVRSIAPHLEAKQTDPAVVVTDERGKYVISLLSGHIGGANYLCEQIAKQIGAIPVITTATDTGGLFSPDSFAVSNDLYITDLQMAKEVAAALLRGETVGVYSEIEYENLPKELMDCNVTNKNGAQPAEIGIYIGTEERQLFPKMLRLIPRTYVLGVGCRKNTNVEHFETTILQWLKQEQIPMEQIALLATIDLKKDEPAVREFAKKYGLALCIYSAEELSQVEGEWTTSAFVEKTTGVDNVCERSAMAQPDAVELIVPKRAGEGVTMAVARRTMQVDFTKRGPIVYSNQIEMSI